MKRVELAYGLSCQVRPLKQAMKMSSRHKQTFFWTEPEGPSSGRPPRLPPKLPQPHWASALCTRPPAGPTPALKELPVQWGDTQTHKVSTVEGIRARREVCDEGMQRLGWGAVPRGCGRAVGLHPVSPGPSGRPGPSEGLEVWTAGSGTRPRSAATTRNDCSPPSGVQYTEPPGTDTRVLMGTVRQPLRPKGSHALLQGLLMAVSSTGPLGALLQGPPTSPL